MEITDWEAAGEIGETAAVALKGKLLGLTVTEYENGVLADILEDDTHVIWRAAFPDMATAKTEVMAQARRWFLTPV